MALIPLAIYRELRPPQSDLAQYLDARGQLYEVQNDDGTVHWFVDDALPRESEITGEIIATTVAFALFAETDEGLKFVGQYPTLVTAEAARASARVVITTPVIEVPHEHPEPDWDSLNGEKQEPVAPPLGDDDPQS